MRALTSSARTAVVGLFCCAVSAASWWAPVDVPVLLTLAVYLHGNDKLWNKAEWGRWFGLAGVTASVWTYGMFYCGHAAWATTFGLCMAAALHAVSRVRTVADAPLVMGCLVITVVLVPRTAFPVHLAAACVALASGAKRTRTGMLECLAFGGLAGAAVFTARSDAFFDVTVWRLSMLALINVQTQMLGTLPDRR